MKAVREDEECKDAGAINELLPEEAKSINKGLKDFEEEKTHLHESVQELYGKYL
jgi:hypothetical protein